MSNTWGDRNGFSRVCEAFVMREIDKAADLGLGTTYVGMFEPEKLLAAFPEMAGLMPIAMLPLGYPAENAFKPRTPRKDGYIVKI